MKLYFYCWSTDRSLCTVTEAQQHWMFPNIDDVFQHRVINKRSHHLLVSGTFTDETSETTTSNSDQQKLFLLNFPQSDGPSFNALFFISSWMSFLPSLQIYCYSLLSPASIIIFRNTITIAYQRSYRSSHLYLRCLKLQLWCQKMLLG